MVDYYKKYLKYKKKYLQFKGGMEVDNITGKVREREVGNPPADLGWYPPLSMKDEEHIDEWFEIVASYKKSGETGQFGITLYRIANIVKVEGLPGNSLIKGEVVDETHIKNNNSILAVLKSVQFLEKKHPVSSFWPVGVPKSVSYCLALENYYLQQVGGTKPKKQKIRMLFWYTIHRIEIERGAEEFAQFYGRTENSKTGKKLVGGAKAFQLCMYIMLFRRDLLEDKELNSILPCPLADIITEILSLPESDIDYTTPSDKAPEIEVRGHIKELSNELEHLAPQEGREINKNIELEKKKEICDNKFKEYWDREKFEEKAQTFAKVTISKISNLNRGDGSYEGLLEQFNIDKQGSSLLEWIKKEPCNRELSAMIARDAHTHLGHTFMPNLHEPGDFEKIKNLVRWLNPGELKRFTPQEYIECFLKTMINYAIKKDLTSDFTRINSMAGVALFVEDLQNGPDQLIQNWMAIYAPGGLYDIERNIPPPTEFPAMQEKWANTLRRIVNKAKEIISLDFFPEQNFNYQIIASKPCGQVRIKKGQKLFREKDLQSILFSENKFDVPNILCNPVQEFPTPVFPDEEDSVEERPVKRMRGEIVRVESVGSLFEK